MKAFEFLLEKKVKTSAWMVPYNIKNNRVLVGKRSNKVNNPGQWNFFGGTVDKHENPLEGGFREFYEEAGVRLNASNIIHSNKIHTGKKVIYYFVVHISKEFTPRLNSEHTTFRWIKLHKLRNMKLHTNTQVILNSLEQELFSIA